MTTHTPLSFFWFRRDLRLQDNTGLKAALESGRPVVPVFIFDRTILDRLQNRADARVAFIHRELTRLREELRYLGSGLIVRIGDPSAIWKTLSDEFAVAEVFCNRDYEPYARQRDQDIHALLGEKGIPFSGRKDHVIFEKNEVMKDDGTPYTVFTPYSRKWKMQFRASPPVVADISGLRDRFYSFQSDDVPALESIGFRDPGREFPPREIDPDVIRPYSERRDIPAVKGTSRLGMHLRFGTVSIRELVIRAAAWSEKWLDELIWREFYQMILYHFPHTTDHAFKPAYDRIPWRHDPEGFHRWCEGKTGYPLVDAGMRELNATGFMHNRVRMVVASFLTKHLLIDWRLGERYFADNLNDFELASNVGGWQWAAGCGCDAAPYFRVFNPTSQQEKFDPEFRYIRQWVPEFGTPAYPAPMVAHAAARERCLSVFREALLKS
jgi:deoxyribodipyrimidine photo-lyase